MRELSSVELDAVSGGVGWNDFGNLSLAQFGQSSGFGFTWSQFSALPECNSQPWFVLTHDESEGEGDVSMFGVPDEVAVQVLAALGGAVGAAIGGMLGAAAGVVTGMIGGAAVGALAGGPLFPITGMAGAVAGIAFGAAYGAQTGAVLGMIVGGVFGYSAGTFLFGPGGPLDSSPQQPNQPTPTPSTPPRPTSVGSPSVG